MPDLFKAELLRFRGWAIAAALVHLVVLGFLARVVDLGQQPLVVHRVFGGVYVAAGLLLGLYQMGGYRRPGAWLNLLHRPLAPPRIATALFGAGTLWLLVAVALPILVVVAYQASMTARVVDLRHWLLPLAALLLATCGYLSGGLAMLGNRRWSACGLVFLAWLVVAGASGFAALAVQGLALLWLVALVGVAFKPDLSAPPPSAAGTFAVAVPVQAGVYLLVLLLGFGIEMLWIMQGSHPNNMAVPPPGGHNELERMDGKDRMLAGLSASIDPQAPLWREQVALSEVHGIGGQVPWVLERNELTNHVPMEFDDARRRVRWTFSHDRMRFEGVGLADGRRAGEFGAGSGNAPFPAPVLVVDGLPGLSEGDAVLVAAGTAYRYASESGRALPRILLPGDERLFGVQPIGEALVGRSDRALYFYDGRDVVESETLLTPRQRLPLPGLSGDLRNVDLIELVDGYLASFAFTNRPHDLRGAAPSQRVLWLRDDGRWSLVADRAVDYDYPAVYRYKAWWPSPVLYALREGATGLFARQYAVFATAPPPVPAGMRALAAGLMLLSLLAAAWMLRGRAMSRRAKVAWIVACGAIGLPALASLWLLHPNRDAAATLPAMQAAVA
ncbi:MAG: hypothetical protein L0H23_07825 [Luteimonas sp.]|nr:hypothetical protein [Luteimonas sp.]